MMPTLSCLCGTPSLPFQRDGALAAIPQPEHVAPRACRVDEGRAAVGEAAVVQVLQLTLLDAELDPVLGRVDDLAQRGERLEAPGVERLAGQHVTLHDIVLVVPRGDAVAVP